MGNFEVIVFKPKHYKVNNLNEHDDSTAYPHSGPASTTILYTLCIVITELLYVFFQLFPVVSFFTRSFCLNERRNFAGVVRKSITMIVRFKIVFIDSLGISSTYGMS